MSDNGVDHECHAGEGESSDESVLDYESSCCSSDEDVEDCDLTEWTPTLDDSQSNHERVIELAQLDCCPKRCLRSIPTQIEKFVHSLQSMTQESKTTSLYTSLAISSGLCSNNRHRGSGKRERYSYFLPFCGEVCRGAFQRCYDVSNDKLNRARKLVRSGNAFVPTHRGKGNQNAKTVDEEAIVRWFRGVVETLADFCNIRFRRQLTNDGTTVRAVVRERIAFLPAYLTWEKLHKEYDNNLLSTTIDETAPSLRSFQRVLRSRCKDEALDAENAAAHAMDARAMREQYAKDIGTISNTHHVSTIDFAQNLTLPHATSAPSSWYFLSLIAVSVFGVYEENTKAQTNFLFSERAGAKGSNEVVSLLHLFAEREGILDRGKCWTIYADNCGGQNKNNHVIRYLLYLVDSGRLRGANLNFFIKGHTKNNCDRGFGAIKKAFAKRDLYTMEQITEMVESSSSSNEAVNLEEQEGVFKNWKAVLEPIYRDLIGIQKYQLFSFDASKPGMVLCRKRPSSAPIEQCIKRPDAAVDSELRELKPVEPPVVNAEKVYDLHKKILSYIPSRFRDDTLYRAPTEDEVEAARAKKRRRVRVTPTLQERSIQN